MIEDEANEIVTVTAAGVPKNLMIIPFLVSKKKKK
jgi:hypothetical protein